MSRDVCERGVRYDAREWTRRRPGGHTQPARSPAGFAGNSLDTDTVTWAPVDAVFTVASSSPRVSTVASWYISSASSAVDTETHTLLLRPSPSRAFSPNAPPPPPPDCLYGFFFFFLVVGECVFVGLFGGFAGEDGTREICVV